MPTAVPHSHRPTTKVTHKPFKSKAASKHELRDRAKGTQMIYSLPYVDKIADFLSQAESPTSKEHERHPTNKSCPNWAAETRPSRLA